MKSSHGGLHGTMSHIVWAQQLWLLRWMGQPHDAAAAGSEGRRHVRPAQGILAGGRPCHRGLPRRAPERRVPGRNLHDEDDEGGSVRPHLRRGDAPPRQPLVVSPRPGRHDARAGRPRAAVDGFHTVRKEYSPMTRFVTMTGALAVFAAAFFMAAGRSSVDTGKHPDRSGAMQALEFWSECQGIPGVEHPPRQVLPGLRIDAEIGGEENDAHFRRVGMELYRALQPRRPDARDRAEPAEPRDDLCGVRLRGPVAFPYRRPRGRLGTGGDRVPGPGGRGHRHRPVGLERHLYRDRRSLPLRGHRRRTGHQDDARELRHGDPQDDGRRNNLDEEPRLVV